MISATHEIADDVGIIGSNKLMSIQCSGRLHGADEAFRWYAKAAARAINSWAIVGRWSTVEWQRLSVKNASPLLSQEGWREAPGWFQSDRASVCRYRNHRSRDRVAITLPS